MKKSVCIIALVAMALLANATNYEPENFNYPRYNAERQRSYERIPIANLDSLMSCYIQSNLERGDRTNQYQRSSARRLCHHSKRE